ncbi:MAG: metallophosphoesterase [Sphingobacteriales bacterium]|nr:MAG: metallophosphoesterase [Sphingobacteriales bacterium]
MKTLSFATILLLLTLSAFSQPFKFAFLSDTHIGIKNADEDLRRTVTDINANTSLKFVIISGDITELGTDEEILLAKSILSKLKIPLYIQTGNHDGNWSPSGGRIFNTVFGPGRFSFQYNGYLFVGTNSGPNMHHKAPGQVPREDILWMDSVLNNPKNRNIPVIYSNHYPQDSSQRNWFEAIDRLKKKNTQLILVGHGHLNTKFVFEGIPGIMGRSNMRAADSVGAYNVVTISNGRATFEERKPVLKTIGQWAEAKLYQHKFESDSTFYSRPSYSINFSFPNVKELWHLENSYDMGGGIVSYNNFLIATNTGGLVYALNEDNGQRLWSFQTKGKIYSTPAVYSNYVVVASTDSIIYCLNARDGKLIWKCKALKPIVASPTIKNNIVYIGSTDGHFRALNLSDGKVKWDYNGVKDFVMTKPLVYDNKIFFGSWGSEFLALDASSGKLVWKWRDTSNNRMYSPAGCQPVGTKGKVFIIAPDQYMTAFDASTGTIIWRTKLASVRVRESMGISADSSMIYIKTTDGKLQGISTIAAEMQIVFTLNLQLGYDICATPVVEHGEVIYVPSNSGLVSAVDSKTKRLIWKHKVSNANIISLLPLNKQQIVVGTEDGKLTYLNFSY